MSVQRGHLYEFGEFRLDTVSQRLLHGNQIVTLTPKVFDLLAVLVQSQGRILSKEELMKAVWPDTYVEEGNLTQNISVLRKTLGAGATIEDYIETIPRQGYRFIAPVIVEEETSRSRLRLGVIFGLMALILAGAATWFLNTRQRASQPRPSVKSLVVLPFVNLSADKDNEYFSDGLTEELINALTRIDGLRVVARTTAFQFKGKAQDVRSIGQQLGVAAVLEGSVRKEQDRLRVTAQLNSVTDGYHFWSQTYDRELKDVFALQEEIAQAIQKTVGRSVGQPTAKQPAPNLEAYNLYLQGRFHRARVFGKSMDKAVAFFEQAVQKDPGYAAAYAALAHCYTELGYSGQLPPREAFPKAVAPLKKALALDDSLAEAHAQQGIVSFLFDWDWDGAKREFQRAITLNPAGSLAHHWYSHYLVAMDSLDESLAESKRALELDPLDLNITGHLAWHYDYARDYDQAIAAAEKSLEIDPNHLPTLTFLQWGFEGAGRFDQAIEVIQKSGGRSAQIDALRQAVRASGASGYWRARIDGALQSPRSNSFTVAELHAHLGDAGQALEWLDRAYQQRHSWLVYLNSDPAFDSIRADPRFVAMVKKVGLPSPSK
ncbi:MAG: winged helix-turn-helix domain-containing protein [Acidobacteria bacterium]|nr:winged helix-turn-helix domain-containing protein [Acidobacteriota bacterium]